MPGRVTLRYLEPDGGTTPAKSLVAYPGTPEEQRFAFRDSLEIGRDEAGRSLEPGLLLVGAPTISFRHCVVSQRSDGRCVIRDLSRNGTRLDGRRLVPNVETEIDVGQTIDITADLSLRLAGDTAAAAPALEQGRTVGAPGFTVATVLVGDIRDYTVLVRQAPSVDLQQSVGRLFERLTAEVARLGGTVKEYQGDAIFAFWEGSFDGRQAHRACAAALALDRLANELAADAAVWHVPGFPLRMEWALATGPVVIDSIGNTTQRAGLSMIGEAVVLAFRLEKFATDDTGPILACEMTHRFAQSAFAFRSLGEMQAKGFERPDKVFALTGLSQEGPHTAGRSW